MIGPAWAVGDPHIQQSLQDGRGGFFTQARLQPGELADDRQRDRDTHETRDDGGLDGRQVRALAFADEAGDLTGTIPSRQRRCVFGDPASRRPRLRLGNLPTSSASPTTASLAPQTTAASASSMPNTVPNSAPGTCHNCATN